MLTEGVVVSLVLMAPRLSAPAHTEKGGVRPCGDAGRGSWRGCVTGLQRSPVANLLTERHDITMALAWNDHVKSGMAGAGCVP